MKKTIDLSLYAHRIADEWFKEEYEEYIPKEDIYEEEDGEYFMKPHYETIYNDKVDQIIEELLKFQVK